MYNKNHYSPFNGPMDNNVCYPTQFNPCNSHVVVCCPYTAIPQYPFIPQPQPVINPYIQQMAQSPYAVKKSTNNFTNSYSPLMSPQFDLDGHNLPDGGYGTCKMTIYGPNQKGLYVVYDNRCHMYGAVMTSEELRQYIFIGDHFDDIDLLLYNNEYHRLLPDIKDVIDELVLSFDNIENMEKFETENATVLDIFSKMSDVKETDHSISFTFNDKAPSYLMKYISDLDYFINMNNKEEENDD